jgi:hypothetical protein
VTTRRRTRARGAHARIHYYLALRDRGRVYDRHIGALQFGAHALRNAFATNVTKGLRRARVALLVRTNDACLPKRLPQIAHLEFANWTKLPRLQRSANSVATSQKKKKREEEKVAGGQRQQDGANKRFEKKKKKKKNRKKKENENKSASNATITHILFNTSNDVKSGNWWRHWRGHVLNVPKNENGAC